MENIKTAVVTGATSGIGFAAARALSDKGVQVIGIGRNEERCRTAMASIREANPEAKVEYMLCDLSSQRGIHALCRELLEKHPVNDILVNAAGLVMSHFMTTEDGLEMQFAVNHLAPFLLAHDLLPALKRSPDARIITVSSYAHRYSRLKFDNLQMHKGYVSYVQYGRTKLMNALFAAEFNRRFKGSSIRAFAVDPGLVKTNIAHNGMIGIEKAALSMCINRGKEPEVSAESICHVALSPDALKDGSLYWRDCHPMKPNRRVYDENAAGKLWEASERFGMTGPWEE
jgi:NAD(P)-dependent dehydrogenase (short-subunit alcohol dehydrogenase family)